MWLLWLVALAGCDLDENFDFSLPPTPPSAEVDYDGSSLSITACVSPDLFGCKPPTYRDSLYVIVDGETHWASAATDPVTLLGGAELGLTAKVPWTGQFVLALDMVKATIDLPSGFRISTPSAVSRAAGPVPITFDLLDSFGDPTVANMRVDSTCEGGIEHENGYGEVTPDTAEITFDDVAAATGTCSHAVSISEWVIASDHAVRTTIVRIEVATFTSTP